MYADCVAEAVAQFQILGSGAHDSGTSDDAFASFWVTKKKALAVMQRIYIDNEQCKPQEKLLALESLTHYNIFECPGQAS